MTDARPAGGDAALRRRQLVVAGCIVVIAAAVAAVLIVLLMRGGSGDDASSSPAATAQAWGKAVLSRDKTRLASLSCPDASGTNGITAIVFTGSGVRAGTATAQGHDTWDVPLTTTGPGGGTTVHVKVERHAGKYLVC